MKMRAIILLLLIVLAACAPQSTSPTPTPLPELSAIFTGVDLFGGTLTTNYPPGWEASGDGSLVSLTSAPGLRGSQDAMPSGAVAMIISPTPKLAFTARSGQDNTGDASAFLSEFIASLGRGGESVSFGEITTLTIGAYEAASVSGTSAQGDALVYALDTGDAYILISAVMASGELTAQEPIIKEIAEATAYRIPETEPAG